jgi:hypothetical protein
MKIPAIHDLRNLTGEFFFRAFRKWGLGNELMMAARSAARLQTTIDEILLGDRSKARETELIVYIADAHIYLAMLEVAMNAKSDVKTAIDARLAELTDKVLK